MEIKIPAIQKEWKVPSNQPTWKSQAISVIKKIKTNYTVQMAKASQYTGVPVNILIAFTATESGGALNQTLNGPSKGVMQVNPSSAWQALSDQIKVDTIGRFYPLYQLAPNAFTVKKVVAANSVGKATDYLILKPLSTAAPYLGQRMVADAQFAIYMGSLLLAQLIAGTIAKTGQIRLDHIIVKYNAGTGRFKQVVTNRGLETASVDTTQLYNQLGIPVSQAYIVKMMGINGYLDVQKQRLA
jgi:hypothetical protein